MGRSALRQGQRKGDFLAGKYLLEDCLGIGGMGEVYRATNVSLGRKVAIKLLSPEYVNIEEDVLRFLREARAAAAVRHANVVDVLDVARDDDGTPFIVQELLSGEDLEHYLRTRASGLAFSEALEIMIPVADAVAAAHAHDVVHRDLKPANIFLARERNRITPKVLDFGACLFPTIAARSAKEVRMLIGTPHYMAPEQIVSKADVDRRSDVWALGIILYEMLVGETPFEAETADEVLELVKKREVPRLREKRKEAPADLDDVLAACTKRDRLARLEDATAVHAALEKIRTRLRGGPSAAWTAVTIGEMPALHAPPPMIPSLDTMPAVKSAPPPPKKRGGLLTLSSPGSEPPQGAAAPDPFDDLDIPAPMDGLPPFPSSPPAPLPMDPISHGGLRELMADENDSFGSLDLASRPSSWPPAARGAEAPVRSASSAASNSSLPPVLDPRAAAPKEPEPKDSGSHAARGPASGAARSADPASGNARPPAAIATALPSREARAWSTADTVRFVAAIAAPALAGFVAALAVPALGAPLGRALRGDSTLASGALAVVALVTAAGLCARSLLGERHRWLYVAAGGGLLFAIGMIIVTSSASEAAETGVPAAMGGFSTLVAPLAPLALLVFAAGRAREAWTDPYERSEAIRAVVLASAMLFLALVLSPVGAVRIGTGRPAHAPAEAP